MISSNYDAILASIQKTELETKEKSDDFLSILKKSSNQKSNLFELLQTSIKNKVENVTNDNKSTNIVSKEDLDEILLKINSFNFVSALSSNTKKTYDKYDKYDKKSDYSFLYNDFNLKYQELVYKHKELANINNDISK